MHTLGTTSLDDLDWTERPWHPAQAYGDSKLLLTTFAAAIDGAGPTLQQRVDPGWVPTGWAESVPPTTWHSAT